MRAFSLEDAATPDTDVNTVRVKLSDDVFAYVREMTAQERDARIDKWWQSRIEQRKQEEADTTGREAWMAAASLCNEDGTWMAADALCVNDLCDKLLAKKSSTVRLILIATQELNGIGKAQIEHIEKK